MNRIKLVICSTLNCNNRVAIIPVESHGTGICRTCTPQRSIGFLPMGYIEDMREQDKSFRKDVALASLGDIWPTTN